MIHRYKIKRQVTNPSSDRPWFTIHLYTVEANGYEALIATVSSTDRDLAEEAAESLASRHSLGDKRTPVFRYESTLTVDDGLD